ncbi:hypothetical protein FPV67DRAFT_894061 [Lyophyllum atratum]|nr:hypothetical protein FPV67DRAFT_894061 [Lyophyllum atratum]
MLEDALQASLPKLVHGVRVADIGQGSEPIRILGIRWLDAGKAGEETEGMQAEEGDFINLEVAFAYRARKLQGSGLKGRSSNAHLLMEFVIVGGVAIPVWVELTGMISTARMRIQLTPNPPFFSLMTLTLLGQPKITLICTPLAKNFFNVMDVPGLSGWVQRSIEAAVSEYVAPRSLHLDLKTLLMGKEQIDTVAVGVVIVTVRRATDFEQGDATKILKSRDGRNGDTYVTIGWSKWGKPLWSTRIIQSEGNPIWEETTALLVGPVEINSQERLRFQLWDCDRMTADDLLGTVDIPLKDLMDRSKNQFSARQDPLTKVDGSPQGTLSWEGGFFYKTTLQQHLEGRRDDVKELVQQIESQAEDKLREAKQRAGQASEIEQQKKEDLNEKTQKIIADSRPKHEWPSGVLTVKIEQIHGLEVQKIKESGVREEGEDEESEDLPSAYCTVIVNHQRVYRTRTKMKSEKPYFDASTEKFIRDWRNSIVIIAVRDARLHEADPLLGVVVLPLHHIFKHKSHINGLFPLVGGIGYGRMSLALTFRSVQAQLPRRLLGWDLGTLDIEPSVSPSLDLPADLASCKLIFRTLYGKGKMRPHQDGGWRRRRGRNLRLAVQKRYSSCLLIQFRKHALGPDKTLAFATLWLKDIPDNEEISVPLSVRKNEEGALERARANASYEIGERVGEITVKLRFWPGLSGYHQNLADKDANMADVMEALDSAEESKEIEQDMLPQAGAGSDSSSSSSSEDDGEEATLDEAKKHGVAGGIKEYRKKKGELHRKHRGLMQWRAARNLAWVARGVEHTTRKVGQKVSGTFKHQDHEIGIEKEV